MLAALVVALRSLALICGGHRAVALENLCRLEPIENPFDPKVLPMCSE